MSALWDGIGCALLTAVGIFVLSLLLVDAL